MLLNDLHRSLWLYCFHFIFPLTSFRLLLTKREVKFWFLIVVDLLSSSASSCHNHCLQKGVLSHAMQGTQFASGHLQFYIACTQPSSHTPCSLSVPCLLAKKKKWWKKGGVSPLKTLHWSHFPLGEKSHSSRPISAWLLSVRLCLSSNIACRMVSTELMLELQFIALPSAVLRTVQTISDIEKHSFGF